MTTALLTAVVCTGCFKTDKLNMVDQTPVMVAPARTNVLQVVRTNTVTMTNYVQVQAAQTNDMGVVTPAVMQPQVTLLQTLSTNVLVDVLPAVYYTNLALGDGIKTIASVGGQVASAAGVPFAGALGSVVAGVGGLIFGWMNHRRKRAAMALADQAQADHSKTQQILGVAQDALGTLVDNFEDLRKAALQIPQYQAIDGQVMDGIKTAQALAGAAVKNLIRDQVDERTGDTITPTMVAKVA